MVRVVTHAEPLADDLRHPPTGPQCGREPERLGTPAGQTGALPRAPQAA
jgi:hypothetical protein